MRQPYTVLALRRQYGQLLGLVKYEGAGDAEDDLAAVGRTLELFHPDEDLTAIRPIRPYKEDRERWTPDALDILRTAGRPMSARELARAVMVKHGLNPRHQERLVPITCGLTAVLERLEGRGVERMPGRPKRWTAG